ncbi:hypothetical protein TSST111916_13975 [Tsukamurella strandjordii]
MRRAERQRELAPVLARIHRDDGGGTRELRPHHRREPHGTGAEHHDRLSRLYFQGPRHGTHARLHAASQRGGELEGQIADRNHVAVGGQGVSGEAGLAEEAARDGGLAGPYPREPQVVPHDRLLAVTGRAARAELASTAAVEGEAHAVAHRETARIGPEGLHHAGALVTEDHGHALLGPLRGESEIGVAHTDRGDPDENLIPGGVRDLHLEARRCLARRCDDPRDGARHRSARQPPEGAGRLSRSR